MSPPRRVVLVQRCGD